MAENEQYTVVLYARVSTDDKGQTNETQLRELRRFCEVNNFVIADRGRAIYTDESTGKDDRRPGLRELKGRISEGDIDFVVARNQDRISRETIDYQKFLDYCSMFRVRVRYSDNSATPETTEGVILDGIQSALAKADNMKRSMATKKGMETARLQGKHCGRYLAMCFSDEVEVNRARIQTAPDAPGVKHQRTVIVSIEDVMDYSTRGISMYRLARYYHIAYSTLIDNMRRRGLDVIYSRNVAAARGESYRGVEPSSTTDPAQK